MALELLIIFYQGLHAPIAAKNWKAFFNLFNPSLPSNRMD